MPVPACLQHPTLTPVPAAGCAMEEAGDTGAEPWGNSNNNNASPGGWPGARGGHHALAPFGGTGYLGRVVLEIVESERTYARDLRSIVEGYLGKIIDAEEPVLRPEQVSALFGNIEDIYELSSTLLQNLESCASDPVAVAVCFVTRSQEFAIYTQYCNNYPSSVAALAECMRSKAQARLLRECQERLCHALPLGAYLLKPVQRILKYHLLLQEIAKHFEHKAGDDYELVLEAIDTMTCVAWHINDMKRKHEHAIRQQEIQSLLLGWKGPDLTSYGELVLEGTFRAQRARHERAVFLFDKTLLITRRRGDHYIYKSHIPCSSLMLIESTRDSLCFSLAHYKLGKQQHSLQARSAEEKRLWTHHIKRLILENHHATIPQKAKEAILEMDLFHPPRLPHCSPERLKKSWSCQPLGDANAEQRQGRRQSEPAKQILQQLGEQGLKHAGSEGALMETGDPPQLPRAWPVPERVVAEEEEQEEEEEEEALGREGQDQLPGARELLLEPQEEQPGDHPASPEGPPRPSSRGAGSCEQAGEHPEGVRAPSTPVAALPVGEADLQGLSSEEEEEEEGDEGSSILPPSVLDQASVIARRFGGGTAGTLSHRSSLALGSRSGSSLSLDDPTEALPGGGSRSSAPSPDPPAPGARRDAALCSRDQQLLEKIRSYYGHAEQRDASLGVRRRESLSFIPKGLVRTSVCRLNGLPRPPAGPEPPAHPMPAAPALPSCHNGLHSPPPEPLLIVEEDDMGSYVGTHAGTKMGINTGINTGNNVGTIMGTDGGTNMGSSVGIDVGTKVDAIVGTDGGAKAGTGMGTDMGADPGTNGGEPEPSLPPRLLLPPRHAAGTKVYQLARQYSLRIKSRRRAGRCPPEPPERLEVPTASPSAPRSPSSPADAEPFAWPDVRELRARFGAPRPPAVSRSRSVPVEPRRGGRPAAKEQQRAGGRSRSAEAGVPGVPPARHGSAGELWVAAEAPLGAGHRVLVLEPLPAPAATPPLVQIRSPTTREKICLKAVAERCKAYQASEEYRRRCPEPPDAPQPPEPAPRGLVRGLRRRFQTLDAAS